jgi:hypothetical protein
MKINLIRLLSACALGVVLFSCKKQNDTPDVSQETTEAAPPAFNTAASTEQVISSSQLAGKYELKYNNTKEDRTWRKTTGVGLNFFPNTFLYSSNKFDFNATTSKVSLSAKTTISGIPDVQYGSYPFALSGENLSITTSGEGAKVKVNYYNVPWLILEDIKTKEAWAFYKQ